MAPKDYSYALVYNTQSFFDLKISNISTIRTTQLKVAFQDPSKVINVRGKKLENNQAEIVFSEHSNMFEGFLSIESIKSTLKVTGVIGQTVAQASSSIISLTSVFGITLGMIGKFLQAIEFTGLLSFFNVKFDLIIDVMFTVISNLGDFDVVDFPFENRMKEDVENSVASKWRAKFSRMEKPTWHLMDIGLSGIYLGVIYLAYAFFWLARA